MIEYSLLDLMAITDSVIRYCADQKLTKNEIGEIRVRLYPATGTGELHFDVGSLRPWCAAQAKH